jgi:hypothetical protein
MYCPLLILFIDQNTVGIVDNDMSSWFQTFVVPMCLKAFNRISNLDSLKPVTNDFYHTVDLSKNRVITSNTDAVVQAIMADYDTRIHSIFMNLLPYRQILMLYYNLMMFLLKLILLNLMWMPFLHKSIFKLWFILFVGVLISHPVP